RRLVVLTLIGLALIAMTPRAAASSLIAPEVDLANPAPAVETSRPALPQEPAPQAQRLVPLDGGALIDPGAPGARASTFSERETARTPPARLSTAHEPLLTAPLGFCTACPLPIENPTMALARPAASIALDPAWRALVTGADGETEAKDGASGTLGGEPAMARVAGLGFEPRLFLERAVPTHAEAGTGSAAVSDLMPSGSAPAALPAEDAPFLFDYDGRLIAVVLLGAALALVHLSSVRLR
ncbi:MAG: hypothetical protein AAGF76_14240, partial [Pseudomonadota bacterium]